MNSTLRDIVLIIIAEEGGRIHGKTLIQKKAYFIGLMLDEDLGHRPHYYGPYSPTIESALGDLRGLGFVEESLQGFGILDQYGFEAKRYDYLLTEDGERAVERLKERNNNDYQKIKKVLDILKDAGNQDYFTMSVAAKAMHILKKKNKPFSRAEIIEEAHHLDWNIPEPVLENSVDFLEKIELVETGQS